MAGSRYWKSQAFPTRCTAHQSAQVAGTMSDPGVPHGNGPKQR